ncbi:MAG TPA: hypothetical protein VEF33_06445 [Syntrophales bacterium]|nr:hypothetical protein [Syntrophales bacterium]
MFIETMRRAYIYKAVINKATGVNCFRWLSLCHTLYNAALEQRIDTYRRCGVSLRLSLGDGTSSPQAGIP